MLPLIGKLHFSVAMVLAAVGIYGVMAHSVAQRTHEIGVRLAIGARPQHILRLILGQGLALTVVGIALGMASSIVLTRALRNQLFEVGSTDPRTFVAVPVLLTGVTLLACWMPVRRATKIDPLVVIRSE